MAYLVHYEESVVVGAHHSTGQFYRGSRNHSEIELAWHAQGSSAHTGCATKAIVLPEALQRTLRSR
ncbi:MAG: hypothetical protein AB8B87_16390 [Granulosicoccus sp.]